ncbi:hypothetical protein H2248_008729 [Termitomyces sp. 'cryptogamus']|nr:hypothetical protein H2248_008729 [Termitomyces sp. 'cryptogamus']
MMSFQDLMALSHTQTEQAEKDVQIALAERTRKEELKRKKAEEQDRKEQELARKRRMMIFEEEKRQRERQLKREQEQAAIEAERRKRAEMERNSYQHGPKKAKVLSDGSAPKWPSSASQDRTREEVRKRRLPDDDDDSSAPEFLTREEKRQRKQQQEMRRLFHPTKRSGASQSKPGKRLPGGAVDVMTGPQSASNASSSTKSVRERLTAMPNTLTKLNTVKRDTRTIDEIIQDRAKLREGKTLEGDQARGFDNWFTDKRETKKVTSTSNAPSGANTPSSQGRSATPQLPTSSKKSAPPVKPLPSKIVASKVSASSSNVKTSSANQKPSTSSTKSGSVNSFKALNGAGGTKSYTSVGKKRPRSPSLSEESDFDSAPPPRRQAGSGYSSTIWELFGKDRDKYVNQDVFSDDEDMEADASALEREELRSARLAKKEDQLALEDERRHEEEKRRRKKDKERLAREMRG